MPDSLGEGAIPEDVVQIFFMSITEAATTWDNKASSSEVLFGGKVLMENFP